MAGQGYGASDQWIVPENIALFDKEPARFNQNTVVAPAGPKRLPQLGVEFGLSHWQQSFLTLGVYNSLDGTSGIDNATTNHRGSNSRKDYRIQYDHLFSDSSAVTLVYFDGEVTLFDPTNNGTWKNQYKVWRLYGTKHITKNLIFVSGLGQSEFGYRDNEQSEATGTFDSPGGFIGLTGLLPKQASASVRFDYFEYSRFKEEVQLARAGTFMLSLPYGKSLINFHYDHIRSDLFGITNDFKIEWRFVL